MLRGPQEICDLDLIEEMGGTRRGILLFEDAVYFSVIKEKAERLMSMVDEVYVISDDLQARGMADRRVEGVKEVDYHGAVDLIMDEYELTVTV